ncbi:hypothetical protein Dcar01_02793 [Deinococcus carri]|uniref:Uncharacterized protein n=1 Tax=Deinococcus carri TaxID=1211323 RepID=A0ABP9W9M9_9DEIO
MSGGKVYRQVEVLRLERDPHALMYAPEQPYRLTLWEPETNVHEDDVPHGCKNLSRIELLALRDVCNFLLGEGEGAS